MKKKVIEIPMTTDPEPTPEPIPVEKNPQEEVNKALVIRLENLEGIGGVRLKKLNQAGVFEVEDVLARGEKEIQSLTDITYPEAKKIVQVCQNAINGDDVMNSMTMSGRDFYKYRKKNIEYLTTGNDELDGIIRGGYESAVITELFGGFGSGKTQFCTVASITAQMPKERCCIECGKKYPLPTKPNKPKKADKEYDEAIKNWKDEVKSVKEIVQCSCTGKIWGGGGLSEFDDPCRVVYVDTENSFRPERVMEIVCNRDLVPTKEQSKKEENQLLDKEPLDEDAEERMFKFLDNIDRKRPTTSALQMAVIENLVAIVNGDFCMTCGKREVSDLNEATHIGHEKVKKGQEGLQEHEFKRNKPARLVIIDSIMAEFRKDFDGRGELSERQRLLAKHIKHLVRTIEQKNVVCLITNQIMHTPSGMGDPTKAVGGNVLAHTSTHRIYLKKPDSLTKNKITAILIDSPDNAKNEVPLELCGGGMQSVTSV